MLHPQWTPSSDIANDSVMRDRNLTLLQPDRMTIRNMRDLQVKYGVNLRYTLSFSGAVFWPATVQLTVMSQILNPWRRRILFAAVALVVVAGAAAVVVADAPWKHAAQPAPVLKVGDQRGPGSVHALLAASGELKDAPYRIEWDNMPAASPLLEALSAGALDLGVTGVPPFAFAYGNGARIRAVVATEVVQPGPGAGRMIAILAPKDSPIHTVADLRGRRVATVKGSIGHDLVLKVLDRAGIDPKSVQFVYLNNGDAKAALSSKAVDAWSTWAPYVGIAVVEGGDRVVVDAGGLIDRGGGFLAASTAALATKKPLIRDFLQRYIRAREWSLTHREALIAQIAKETGLSPEVARYSVAEGAVTALTPINDTLINEQRAIFQRFLRAGVIDKMPPLDSGGYDGSFNDLVATQPARAAP
jgi:sulfonate transport system substrate-binding protein